MPSQLRCIDVHSDGKCKLLVPLLTTPSPSLAVKVLLVGRENVGKSSLARALANAGVAHLRGSAESDSLANSADSDGDAASSTASNDSPLLGARSVSRPSSGTPTGGRRRLLLSRSAAKAAKNLSTDGIASATVALDWTPANGPTVRGGLQIDVWDFAGQALYGATHQFFVSPRSIFIVCFDLRHERDEAIERWLETIVSRAGPDAPVLLVGTPMDEPECTDLRVDAALDYLYDKFHQRFPNISAYAPVSTNPNWLIGLPEVFLLC